MKLTKKDKIMLLILGVVIIVAVFYMYGIMPANEQIEQLDATIGTKKQQADALQNRLVAIAGQNMDQKIDEILEYYFANNEEGTLHEQLDKIEIEKMMCKLFAKYKITGFSTTSWNVIANTYNSTYDNIVVTNEYYIAKIPVAFEIEKEADFRRFLDDMRDDEHFRVTNFNIKKNDKPDATPSEPTDPPAEPEKFNELSGTMNIEFYMGNKYVSNVLPKALPVVENVVVAGNIITFDKLEHAVAYEAYNVTYDEEGKPQYQKIDRAEFVEKNGKIEVQILAGMLPITNYNIAIRAIGDRKEYYKTRLQDIVPVIVDTSTKA